MPESCHPTLGGASNDRLNGFQMDRKSGLLKEKKKKRSVIPGGQGECFWQADLSQKKWETWNRWNVNHGERRTCVTKGMDGKHMSHFTLIYLSLPNPCQIKGRRGGEGGGE